jgi:phage/plasmid-associated DNA primase
MRQSRSEYENYRNSISAFMSPCLEKDPAADGMKFGELYQIYSSFCESEGFERVFPQKGSFEV